MTAGILSERRAVPPFGLFGGRDGEKGLNLLRRADGRVVNLGGKATVQLSAGDVMCIHTPGAGGYGEPAGTTHTVTGSAAQAYTMLEAGSVHEYRRMQESA
jgi:5-oxoprolinase (ATP-hydrolysing)